MSEASVQRAAQWMARLWADDASEQDRQACAAWRAAHPGHEQAWQALQTFEHKLHSVPAPVARQALREPPHPDFVARRRALQVLGLGVAAGGAAWLVQDTESWQLAMAAHRTATGEVRELALPDGTRLVLASASAIDLKYTSSERRIVLRAGEVLIATAHDPRPLRVQSRQGTLRALGTRFSVRQQHGESRIAVFEGAVEIRPAAAGDEAVRLNAGYGASLSAERVGAYRTAQESEAAWSRGLLVADQMRLDEFLAELSRYRPGLLRCAPDVAGLRVSGVFPLRDTQRALHNLTLGLPVQVSYRTRYWATVHGTAGSVAPRAAS